MGLPQQAAVPAGLHMEQLPMGSAALGLDAQAFQQQFAAGYGCHGMPLGIYDGSGLGFGLQYGMADDIEMAQQGEMEMQ